jgi:hypothetical protein
MAKKYPAVGHKKKPRNTGGLPCIVCGMVTTGKVTIEVNYFRGDDKEVRVCEKCQKESDEVILKNVDRDIR